MNIGNYTIVERDEAINAALHGKKVYLVELVEEMDITRFQIGDLRDDDIYVIDEDYTKEEF